MEKLFSSDVSLPAPVLFSITDRGKTWNTYCLTQSSDFVQVFSAGGKWGKFAVASFVIGPKSFLDSMSCQVAFPVQDDL